VGERREGRGAAGAGGRAAGAPRLDGPTCLGVVRMRDERLVAAAALEREGALRRLRQDDGGREPQADLALEPEPVETAGGEDDRVEPPLAPLPETRVDVPAQRLDRERGLEGE